MLNRHDLEAFMGIEAALRRNAARDAEKAKKTSAEDSAEERRGSQRDGDTKRRAA